MLARSLVVSLALLAVGACKIPTDLGAECRMFKKNPDGGTRAVLIRENEIKAGANKDFISFGSTDCENLTCVRDAEFTSDGGFDGGVTDGGEGIAIGYCSNVCAEGSVCSAGNPADDNDAKRRLNCRALLLDAETLKALCAAGQCLQGTLESPFFCARGVAPDAGM